MKDPHQTRNGQALMEKLSGTGMRGAKYRQVLRAHHLAFPVQCAINYSYVNIQIPYKIKYPCKLASSRQQSLCFDICARRSRFYFRYQKILQ